MKLPGRGHALLALVGVLAAPRARVEPAAESVVERRSSLVLELETESFEFRADEEGHTSERHGPDYVRHQSDRFECSDRSEDEEDPAAAFTRTYRTIQSSFRMGTEQKPREGESHARLEGQSVDFEREDDGSWSRRADEVDARAGQLDRLRAELDLGCFLPPESAPSEPDTRWEIPPAAILRLISPVEEGRHRVKPAKKGPKKGIGVSPGALTEPLANLLASIDGTFEGIWIEDARAEEAEGEADEDELPCRARFEFRLSATDDGGASVITGAEAEVEDEVQLLYEGTGDLAWDPSDGRIELTLEGDLSLEERFQADLRSGDKSGQIQGHFRMAGTLALEASQAPGE